MLPLAAVATTAFQVPHVMPMPFRHAIRCESPLCYHGQLHSWYDSGIRLTMNEADTAEMDVIEAEIDEAPSVVSSEPMSMSLEDLAVDLQMARSVIVGNNATITALKDENKALKAELATVSKELAAARKDVLLGKSMLLRPTKLLNLLMTVVVGSLGAMVKTAAEIVAAPFNMIQAFRQNRAIAKARAAQSRGSIVAVDENDNIVMVKAVVMPEKAQAYSMQKLEQLTPMRALAMRPSTEATA